MRLQGLALCLLLAACGGSKHAQAPMTESATMPAPGGGAPAEGAASAADPTEAAKPATAPAPMATESKATSKPKTRGAQKTGGPKGEDPDAGGE